MSSSSSTSPSKVGTRRVPEAGGAVATRPGGAGGAEERGSIGDALRDGGGVGVPRGGAGGGSAVMRRGSSPRGGVQPCGSCAAVGSVGELSVNIDVLGSSGW